MKIDTFKIGARLNAAFGIVLLMLVVIATLGVTRMAAIQTAMVDITKGNDVESNLASEMRLSLDDRLIALRNIVLLDDPAQMQAQIERVNTQAKNYETAEKKLRDTFTTFGIEDDESKLLEEIGQQSALAQPLIEKVQALGLDNNNAEATKLLIGDLRADGYRGNDLFRLCGLNEI